MRDALSAEVEVFVDGRPQRVSKFRVILEKLMATASKGDFKAAAFVIELGQKIDDEPATTASDDAELTPDDHVILDRHVEKCIGRRSKGGGHNA